MSRKTDHAPRPHARSRAARWVAAFGLAAALGVGCGTSQSNGLSSSGKTTDAGASGGTPLRDGSTTDAPTIVIGPGKSDASSSGTDASGGGSSSPATCDPSCQAAGGTCTAGACVINENPGGLSSGSQGALSGGGSADPSFAWLYPYDKTVLPRGLLPPKMQFAGTDYDEALVQVSFSGFSYTGFFGAPSGTLSANQLQLSQKVWTALANAAQATSGVRVSVTKSVSGAITGPITETWGIAQGTIRGTIYYETYGSTILGGSNSVGIMKIQPGATVPTVVKSGCGNVCHTASADGSTLVAATTTMSSASYNLLSGAATLYTAQNYDFTYGGIYPDGTFVMSATNYRTWTNGNSLLYDTKTGAKIATTGWTITNAGTPAFSPDGTMIAYNAALGKGGKGGTLGVANFDKVSKTFSNLTDIATAPDSQNPTLAWPAFAPDTKSVVFHAGSSAAFETDKNATGDLFGVDLATRTRIRLDAADGYTAPYPATASYLPANDPGLNFAPTMLPEAVGGYFWVVFTSHRSYGNTTPSKDNGDQNGKLWVAAIDIAPAAGADPSHPAFFLDGQETSADNLRGFWVLNPCQADGTSCSSGDECCGGYCRSEGDGGLVCLNSVPDGGSCSQEYEKCTTASDCCNTNEDCINGRCSIPPAPPQ